MRFDSLLSSESVGLLSTRMLGYKFFEHDTVTMTLTLRASWKASATSFDWDNYVVCIVILTDLYSFIFGDFIYLFTYEKIKKIVTLCPILGTFVQVIFCLYGNLLSLHFFTNEIKVA